jgi:hypothetical protein
MATTCGACAAQTIARAAVNDDQKGITIAILI